MKTFFSERNPRLQAGYILLADDDEDDRMLMHDFFSANGYQSLLLPSGLALLKHLASVWPQQYPAAIMLDCNMPGLSGEETLRCLKQSETLWHIPVIVYSTEMNTGLSRHLQSLGAFGCFSKRYDHGEFVQIQQSLQTLLHYCSTLA